MDVVPALVVATLRIATPYVWAALGGFWSERAGIVNLALEGKLLFGALATVLVAERLETAGLAPATAAWAGVAAAALAGAVAGAVHAFATVRARGDAITSGIALNLLALGLTELVLTRVFASASNSPRIGGMEPWPIPGLAAWAPTRVLLCTPLVFLAWVAVLASQHVTGRTRFGLRHQAAGEAPRALAVAGVAVGRLRVQALLISGALAGLGGAWLALDQHQFTAGMSNGRGFIALAALIFGKWTPRGAALACLLFAAAEAVQIQMQARGAGGPSQLVQMLPYVVTLVALVGVVGRSRPPAALGQSDS
jgi:simple sugar transport system permease protein